MFGKCLKLFAVAVFLLSFALNSFAKTQITGMEAKLFYQNTGKFSEDIFSQTGDLWNVYFDYVYSTLVIVEVEGKPDGKQFIKPRKIEFFARYKPFFGSTKETTIVKTSPIWLDENGKAKIGFWLDNVGCHPVKISAKISGQKTTLRKTINFGCGE